RRRDRPARDAPEDHPRARDGRGQAGRAALEAPRGRAGVSLIERWLRLQNRALQGIRHRGAFSLTPSTTGFDALRGRKHAILTTYRRSGEAVPTVVWFGLDDAGRMYLRTEADAFKVKRLRRNPEVLVAPSDVRGKPKGPAAAGTARVLDASENDHAER